MKPGNLFKQGAKSGGKRKMRIRSNCNAHRIFGVRFFFVRTNLRRKRKENKHGKKTLYL